MDDSVLEFYEELANEYHLIYEDWDKSIQRQARVLDKIIQDHLRAPPLSVLDCSCGIGTQAIGLALLGYKVHATDLSPKAVQRAQGEARRLGAEVTFGVTDLQSLKDKVEGAFNVVISCDNSLPHLLSDKDLLLAARNIASKLKTDGLLLVSIRDYDRLVRERPRSEKPRVFDASERRRIVFQVWDWSSDGRTYMAHQFIIREAEGKWKTSHYAVEYRALLRDELSKVLREAGFSDIRWHMPKESGFYQPIVTARKH
jgi:2-polyprenyl-3-methyl-5-hydroxy-6-metoxy-1,4-benzoquinol methylase